MIFPMIIGQNQRPRSFDPKQPVIFCNLYHSSYSFYVNETETWVLDLKSLGSLLALQDKCDWLKIGAKEVSYFLNVVFLEQTCDTYCNHIITAEDSTM